MTQTEKFADEFGQRSGFDPLTVLAIIQSLMEIFQNCPQSGGQLRASVKAPTRWQKLRATNIVMANLDLPRRQARQVAEDLIAAGMAATDEQVGAVVDECCDPGRW